MHFVMSMDMMHDLHVLPYFCCHFVLFSAETSISQHDTRYRIFEA